MPKRQLIQDEWARYRDENFEEIPSEDIGKELQRAFFGGASIVFAEILGINMAEIPEKEKLERINYLFGDVSLEIIAFMEHTIKQFETEPLEVELGENWIIRKSKSAD